MKLKELLKELKISEKIPSIEISGINYDSRKIKSGELFIAVKGLSSDGHNFIQTAASIGAVAAIVETKDKSASIPQYIVKDSRDALANICANWFGYPARKMKIIGVTGTNGKTTTTYILEAIVKHAGKKPGVIGTVNYRYAGKTFPATHTTPDCLALQELLKKMLDSGVDFVIMEVSSHALELKRVNGVDFDVAIFTNLTQDHLDFHKNLKNYFESKALFFTTLIKESVKPNKYSIINIDDPKGKELSKRSAVKTLTFGISKSNKPEFYPDFYIDNLKFSYTGLEGSFGGKLMSKFHSSLVGMHNAYNILGAAGAAIAAGIDEKAILKGISEIKGVPGRLERVSRENKKDPLILVDYAHTDDALRNVLSALRALQRKGRIITVFGCGGDRDPLKRPLMGKAAISSSDLVIVTSDNPRTEDPKKIIEQILPGINETGAKKLNFREASTKSGFIVESDRRQAIYLAIDLALTNDIVLIAGKGHEDYQIIGKEKIHFDDREVALEALEKKKI